MEFPLFFSSPSSSDFSGVPVLDAGDSESCGGEKRRGKEASWVVCPQVLRGKDNSSFSTARFYSSLVSAFFPYAKSVPILFSNPSLRCQEEKGKKKGKQIQLTSFICDAERTHPMTLKNTILSLQNYPLCEIKFKIIKVIWNQYKANN